MRAAAEFPPTEDVFLPLLRARFPTLSIQTLVDGDRQTFPFVLVRRGMNGLSGWDGDERFIDNATLIVECFTQDPDGDQDGAVLSEAIRVALRDIAKQQLGVDGLGYVLMADVIYPPHRSPDWATSTGPVQYADLPTGTWRYETVYEVKIRKAR